MEEGTGLPGRGLRRLVAGRRPLPEAGPPARPAVPMSAGVGREVPRRVPDGPAPRKGTRPPVALRAKLGHAATRPVRRRGGVFR